ncbi:MAG: methionine adenosyltransferase [Bacilli bacterium]|jgi:S-adenosylmethionine synthetase|nr:methionine adenosyltransferase [Bacilli bacterium]
MKEQKLEKSKELKNLIKDDSILFTSESVTEGHPDKLCDKIADSILDAYLSVDEKAHVACEVIACADAVVIFGEITCNNFEKVDPEKIARKVICDVGYDNDELGFNGNTIPIQVRLIGQSPDINLGVGDDKGAGDQGMMFGYACTETKELMPATIRFAHDLTHRLAQLRKNGAKFLRPDGKAQVTIEYKNGKMERVDNVVLSTQHTEDVDMEFLKDYIIKNVIEYVIPKELIDEKTTYLINPTGRFCIGGPVGDSGLTGRKIIVDTYGGIAHHGGGAFSGKDPSKVDRSACYMMRYIAKNIVASGIASRVEVQVSYAIGVAEPTSVRVDSFGTSKYSDNELIKMVRAIFPLTPGGLIKHLKLRTPIYARTTNYGHFGEDEFSWEKVDKVEEIKNYFINK